MSLENIKEGEVIIVTQGNSAWAERVTGVTPTRIRTTPPQNYDISSDCEYDKITGKVRGRECGNALARKATPDDDQFVIRLELSQMDWDNVPVETLRKISDLLRF